MDAAKKKNEPQCIAFDHSNALYDIGHAMKYCEALTLQFDGKRISVF